MFKILRRSSLLVLVTAGAWAPSSREPSPPAYARPTCDVSIASNPLGLDVMQPRLSWVLDAPAGGREQGQSAWQVLVAGTPGGLARNQGDLWDSGKVLSDQQVQITYHGKPLASA